MLSITSKWQHYLDMLMYAIKTVRASKSNKLVCASLLIRNSLMIRLGKIKNLVKLQSKVNSIFDDYLIIFACVPFDDIGGGQRSSQLARCAIKTGRRVKYVYAYPKYDFKKGRHIASDISIPLLEHTFIDETNPESIFHSVSVDSTILFEAPHPNFVKYLEYAFVRGIKTFYDLIDDWDTSLGGGWYDKELHVLFAKRCDRVAASAKVLREILYNYGRHDALYLPNAANEEIFNKYKSYQIPVEYKNLNHYKKKFIYFGSLYGEWFAWNYLERAAIENQDSCFVLIGDYNLSRNLPNNVYTLGPKNVDELPPYLYHSSAALLPFVPSKISDAVSPIKVFEYLFMGKPVISTHLPEILGYPNIYTAKDEEEYSYYCKMIGTSSDSLVCDTDSFVSENSWYARLSSIISYNMRLTVSFIILIHNNKDIISRALDSLKFHCANISCQIIVVDNNSSDGGYEIVSKKHPDVTLIRNSINGCSSGRNIGLDNASGDFIAFLDSDQWFTSNSFIFEAVTILNKFSGIGAISWNAGWFDKYSEDLSGVIVDGLPYRAMDSVEAKTYGFRTDIAYLATSGMFVPSKIAKSTKGFDTYYDPTCFEDTDYSFQIKSLGFSLAYRDLTGIQHQPHQTTKASSKSDTYTYLFNRNASYFRQKWAMHQDFFLDYKG